MTHEDEEIGNLSTPELRRYSQLKAQGATHERAMQEVRGEYLTQHQAIPAMSERRRMKKLGIRCWHIG